MNQQSKSRVQLEPKSRGIVFLAVSGSAWSVSIQKEYELPVATEKEIGAKSNNSFLYLWLLMGSLMLLFFSLSQLPKMITIFQDVLLEEPQPTWVRD